MTAINVDEILKRMRVIFEVETNKDLSEYLGFSKQTLSGWISRETIPLDVLLSVANQKAVRLDWLVYGKEEKCVKLSTHEKMALMAFNDLDDRGKIEAISLMTNLKNIATAHVNQTASGNGVNVNGAVTIQK